MRNNGKSNDIIKKSIQGEIMMKQPHIQCSQDDVAKMVILPGDPARVDRVAKYLDEFEEIAFNREFKSIKGKYKGMEVTVISTGIGGVSAGIAVEELVACGAEYLIRIGSLGAYQTEIKIGDLVIAEGAVREDGASKMYIETNYPAVPSSEIVEALKRKVTELDYPHHLGIVRSHDSFYIDNEEEVIEYWHKKGVMGGEMEASTLFTIGRLRGIKTGAILNNVVLYKDDVKEGIGNYVDTAEMAEEGEKREIILALEALLLISEK